MSLRTLADALRELLQVDRDYRAGRITEREADRRFDALFDVDELFTFFAACLFVGPALVAFGLHLAVVALLTYARILR